MHVLRIAASGSRTARNMLTSGFHGLSCGSKPSETVEIDAMSHGGNDSHGSDPKHGFSLPSQIAALLGWVLVASAAGAVGAVASVDAASFYAQLNKPGWAPPAWVFGPVWTALYVLMGIAAWLVWRTPGSAKGALALFAAQLAANALWSWLFFAWHQGALAAYEILALLALIAATMAAFWRISRPAAILLLPYLLWVSFAAVLTWSLWQRNSALLS